MRQFLGTIAAVVLVVVFVTLLGWGMGWWSLWASRPMARYAENTRHQVFQQSAAREEGINKGILSECLSMRSATDDASRRAMAKFIIADAGMYEGHLTPAAQACVDEAQHQS